MSRNLAILVGRVGSEPRYKETQHGSVCNFTLATSENWTDKSGVKQERTEWHNITVWKHTADFVHKYVDKGDSVYVEGAIQSREYEAKDGSTKKVVEIKARSVQKLSQRKKEEQPSEPGELKYELTTESGFTADDIPF